MCLCILDVVLFVKVMVVMCLGFMFFLIMWVIFMVIICVLFELVFVRMR